MEQALPHLHEAPDLSSYHGLSQSLKNGPVLQDKKLLLSAVRIPHCVGVAAFDTKLPTPATCEAAARPAWQDGKPRKRRVGAGRRGHRDTVDAYLLEPLRSLRWNLERRLLTP